VAVRVRAAVSVVLLALINVLAASDAVAETFVASGAFASELWLWDAVKAGCKESGINASANPAVVSVESALIDWCATERATVLVTIASVSIWAIVAEVVACSVVAFREGVAGRWLLLNALVDLTADFAVLEAFVASWAGAASVRASIVGAASERIADLWCDSALVDVHAASEGRDFEIGIAGVSRQAIAASVGSSRSVRAAGIDGVE